jgi:hypothetical protein
VEAPPLPDSVRIDVGTLRPLRSDRAGETFWHMDWGLFRCLAREVATLGTRSLEIADFGADQPWPHLSAALRFCRQQCRLAKISVYTDPLTADIGVLDMATILTQMNRNAVGTTKMGLDGAPDGIGFVGKARLPQCGDVVDIDAKFDHGSCNSLNILRVSSSLPPR